MKKLIFLIFLFSVLDCFSQGLSKEYNSFIKAIKKNNLEKVMALIKDGVNVNEVGFAKFTPLYFAIEVGNVEIVKALVKAGGDINYPIDIGDSEYSPISFAVYNNNYEITKYLLESGARIFYMPQKNPYIKFTAPLEEVINKKYNISLISNWHYSFLFSLITFKFGNLSKGQDYYENVIKISKLLNAKISFNKYGMLEALTLKSLYFIPIALTCFLFLTMLCVPSLKLTKLIPFFFIIGYDLFFIFLSIFTLKDVSLNDKWDTLFYLFYYYIFYMLGVFILITYTGFMRIKSVHDMGNEIYRREQENKKND